MRARELLCVLALAVACTTNPDPRKPTVESMQRNAFGGWVVVTLADREVSGELLAIDARELYVLEYGRGLPRVVKLDQVRRAELFEYVSGDFAAWGIVGTLSTASHGYWLVFSAPIWILTSAIASSLETHHMILAYPDAGWDGFARWARFPQGPPDRLRERVRERLAPPSLTPPV